MHRSMVLAGVLVLALAGCGGGAAQETASDGDAAEEKAVAAEDEAAVEVTPEPVGLEEEEAETRGGEGALSPSSSTETAVAGTLDPGTVEGAEGAAPEGLLDTALCEQVLTVAEIEAVVGGAVTDVDADVNDNEFVPTVTCSYASDSPIFSLILFIGFNEGGSGRTVFDDFIADGTTVAVDGLGIAASQHAETGSYTAYVTDDIAINSVVLAVDDASAEWELALIRTAVENLTGVVAG